MKLVFRFGRYKLNTSTNPKLKVKNFLSFSVSYIFAIIIIIIIIIIITLIHIVIAVPVDQIPLKVHADDTSLPRSL